ncbi:hypothetical protein C6503_26795 [Candidatus Poribacteria bacterium]|nr:MAG: hypothetical protein C6503_26795 [Candidatus Poribacteria bacterium]
MVRVHLNTIVWIEVVSYVKKRIFLTINPYVEIPELTTPPVFDEMREQMGTMDNIGDLPNIETDPAPPLPFPSPSPTEDGGGGGYLILIPLP